MPAIRFTPRAPAPAPAPAVRKTPEQDQHAQKQAEAQKKQACLANTAQRVKTQQAQQNMERALKAKTGFAANQQKVAQQQQSEPLDKPTLVQMPEGAVTAGRTPGALTQPPESLVTGVSTARTRSGSPQPASGGIAGSSKVYSSEQQLSIRQQMAVEMKTFFENNPTGKPSRPATAAPGNDSMQGAMVSASTWHRGPASASTGRANRQLTDASRPTPAGGQNGAEPSKASAGAKDAKLASNDDLLNMPAAPTHTPVLVRGRNDDLLNMPPDAPTHRPASLQDGGDDLPEFPEVPTHKPGSSQITDDDFGDWDPGSVGPGNAGGQGGPGAAGGPENGGLLASLGMGGAAAGGLGLAAGGMGLMMAVQVGMQVFQMLDSIVMDQMQHQGKMIDQAGSMAA